MAFIPLGILAASGAGAVGDYESIATVLVGSGGTSAIDFTSIPSTYKHLQIRGIILNAASNDNLAIRLGNGSIDTGSNYASHQMQGQGSGTPSAGASTSQNAAYLSGLVIASSAYPFAFVYDILDYASVSKNKTLRGLSGQDGNATGTATDWRVQLTSGLWMNSSNAINAIRIYLPAGNVGQHSQFALYGIKG
jgi:hypothetical protein